jgi:hypothetical protein
MPATAADATRVHTAPAGVDQEPAAPEIEDPMALDWSEIARVLAATDEDDVPLFGRVPA